jgi:hypothetical protein
VKVIVNPLENWALAEILFKGETKRILSLDEMVCKERCARYEDFQSSGLRETICHHRSPSDNIPLKNSPRGFSFLPFFPFKTFGSDKVVPKSEAAMGMRRGLRILCASENSMLAIAFLPT